MTLDFLTSLCDQIRSLHELATQVAQQEARSLAVARCPFRPGTSLLAYGDEQGWFRVAEVGGYLDQGEARWCLWVRSSTARNDEVSRWDELDFRSGRIRVM
jgi:hypothetical protein